MEEQAEAAGEQPKAAAAAKGAKRRKKKAADGGRGKGFSGGERGSFKKGKGSYSRMRTISRANPPIRMCCTEEISRMRA